MRPGTASRVAFDAHPDSGGSGGGEEPALVIDEPDDGAGKGDLRAQVARPDARNADTFKEVPPGEPPSLVNPPSGCRFHPRCPHFMAGLCDVKVPPDFEPEPNHFVKCWLYEEPAALSAELSAIANAVPAESQTESVA